MVPHVDPLDIAPVLLNSYLYLSRYLESLSTALQSALRGHLVPKYRNSKPYFYRQFWENGKQYQLYVHVADVEHTRQVLDDNRALRQHAGVFRSILDRTAKALRHFGIRVDQLLAQASADELLRQQEEAGRLHALEVAQHKPFSNNYRLLVPINGVPTYVASKSEALLAQSFTFHGLRFEYEPSFTCDGVPLKGDFKVYHKYRPDVFFYWEHLGLLHDPEYRRRWDQKREAYRKLGIVEGLNLIVTRDGPDGSLDLTVIHRLITQYLEI